MVTRLGALPSRHVASTTALVGKRSLGNPPTHTAVTSPGPLTPVRACRPGPSRRPDTTIRSDRKASPVPGRAGRPAVVSPARLP